MTDVAEKLLALLLVVPLGGALLGSIFASWRANRTARLVANLAVSCTFILSAALAVILASERTAMAIHLDPWITLNLPKWIWRIDQYTALWLAVSSGLACATLSIMVSPDDDSGSFSLVSAFAVCGTTGFLLSTTLTQAFGCWVVLSLTTLALVGWSSSSSTASLEGVRRMIQIGLPGDLLMLWGLLMIGQAGGVNPLAATSPTELTGFGANNPALPGLIACLMILGVVGRCGLFPLCSWHQGATAWEMRSCIMIYCVVYVPSAVGLLLKCQPLLTHAEVPLSLMGGLGALGAVVCGFLACCEQSRRRVAYLMAAQAGMMLVGLASGHDQAIKLCVWQQCLVSVSGVVLFAVSSGAVEGVARWVAWCSLFTIIGLVPCGGWTQQTIVELNLHPMRVVVTPAEDDESVVENKEPLLEALRESASPRWAWICAVWVALGLSACAAIQTVLERRESHAPSTVFRIALHFLGMLLITAGLLGWRHRFLSGSISPAELQGLVIGQSVIVIGLIAGWRIRSSGETARDQGISQTSSLLRLCQQGLAVDQTFLRVFGGQWRLVQRLTSRVFSPQTIDRGWTSTVVHGMAWLGTQVESLLVSRPDFYIATILLGSATLLLTLILIG